MSASELQKHLTPRQTVEALDRYIIGQHEAKRQIAIALRNRWRAQQADIGIRDEIMPNNILMIGPTGVGKTELARRLAQLSESPFVKVEASKFTEVGYVGRDVESMVRDLVEQSIRMARELKKNQLLESVKEIVEERILDILIPVTHSTHQSSSEADAQTDQELNRKTRAKFLAKLKAGELDERKIEIDAQVPQQAPVGMMAGGTMDEFSLVQIQEMLGNLMPKKKKKKKLTIAAARKLLLDEELDRRIDMDEIKEWAIERVQSSGIIFIDEIDKIAGRGHSDQPNISQEGVQRDLLPIIEGSVVNTKYGSVRTDQMLFIAAGAFHVSKPSDLIPELQGRFPIRIELESLSEKDFLRILSEPQSALTKQYQALLRSEQIELHFTPSSLKKIAEIAYKLNASIENIGARRLHTVMGTVLAQYMFEIPDQMPKNKKISVTAQQVERSLKHIIDEQDLSRYLL